MKTGRPKIEVDKEELIKLMEIQCTEAEIAGWFECSIDTIERRCKELFSASFAETIKIHASKGKMSLRRAQIKAAMAGNVTMLIWLGKQYLNQRDRAETDLNIKDEIKGITFDE